MLFYFRQKQIRKPEKSLLFLSLIIIFKSENYFSLQKKLLYLFKLVKKARFNDLFILLRIYQFHRVFMNLFVILNESEGTKYHIDFFFSKKSKKCWDDINQRHDDKLKYSNIEFLHVLQFELEPTLKLHLEDYPK